MLALEGIKILDLTWQGPGPFGTMILGDLGADVIKIGPPPTAGVRQTTEGAGKRKVAYQSINRNKRSIMLNLRSAEGRHIFLQLAEKADVIVESFRPGVAKRLKIDYETITEINPGIIYCSISAYGQDGPYRDRPGYDMVLSAVGGLMYITGEQEGDPCKVGVAITDVLTGVHASGAIMASLIWRGRSGKGQYIDCSLLDIQASALANIGSNYLVAGEEARRWGTAHASIVPYQVFKTKDHPISIAAANQKIWVNFAKALGKAEWLDDPRFESNPKRVEHRDILLPLVAERMQEKTCDEWMELLLEASVPCGPVNNMERLFSDPQMIHRNMIAEVEHPTIGTLKLCGVPIKYSDTPGAIRRPPPLVGEHTEEILKDVLGYDSGGIDELRRDGVI